MNNDRITLKSEHWEEVKEAVKVSGISEISYKTWIEPLELFKIEGDNVYIIFPISAAIEYISNKWSQMFTALFYIITKHKYNVHIVDIKQVFVD